jgi:hypothetical protein
MNNPKPNKKFGGTKAGLSVAALVGVGVVVFRHTPPPGLAPFAAETNQVRPGSANHAGAYIASRPTMGVAQGKQNDAPSAREGELVSEKRTLENSLDAKNQAYDALLSEVHSQRLKGAQPTALEEKLDELGQHLTTLTLRLVEVNTELMPFAEQRATLTFSESMP